MSMALSPPLYGGETDLATAMNLVKVLGMRPSDLPAFNSSVKSLQVVLHKGFLMEGRGTWPETYWREQFFMLLRSALRFNPGDRPSAEEIVRSWDSIEG